MTITVVCSEGCGNGHCSSREACTCHSGWTGKTCDVGMLSINSDNNISSKNYVDYNYCISAIIMLIHACISNSSQRYVYHHVYMEIVLDQTPVPVIQDGQEVTVIKV